ncbi:Uncharacterised protein [Citrobacter koseri]|nr:Uncharacterised protein [Citrobacter koseri]
MTYGASAVEFVKSTEDINASIAERVPSYRK